MIWVVDEFQDLFLDTFFEFLDALTKGGMKEGTWRLFLDPHQDVFSRFDPKTWELLQKAEPARFTLNINCRNTPDRYCDEVSYPQSTVKRH